jgi:cysteine-rich repeat protein
MVVCGDGVVGGDEACDDGNTVSGDGCQPDCTPSYRLPAMYPFEGTGNIVRDVANGNDGILAGGALRTEAGRFGDAIEFDGVAGRVDLGTLSLTGPFTIAFWFRAHDFGTSDARFISKATGVAEQEHVFMLSTIASSGSRLRFRLRTTSGGTSTLIASGATIPVGTWVHAAAVWTGSQMLLYQDGVLVGSLAKSGTHSAEGTVATWIGNQPGGGRPFDGEIDEFLIDGRAYTIEEIVTVMTAPLPRYGPLCGNGLVDPGELCDDGNPIDIDACQNDCTPPIGGYRHNGGVDLQFR